jgi:nicotinate-nucleotide pyrophosphorylase (carboxylating)
MKTDLETMETRFGKNLPTFPHRSLAPLLELAFAEDLGDVGDVTSDATLPKHHASRAVLSAKEPGVVCGQPVVEAAFRHRGTMPGLEWKVQEGQEVKVGEVLGVFTGETLALLTCERVILNFLQRMGGVATRSREFARAAGSFTRVLDTRKTLPGFRALDKYAVAVGGGANHRMGLWDQVLIKDNHIFACGSVKAAVEKARECYGRSMVIEAEVKSLEELRTLWESSVDIVLLDNMDDTAVRTAVTETRIKAPRIKLEASGNMDLERVRRLADAGLDFISVGALTHSVKAWDLTLNLESMQEPLHG